MKTLTRQTRETMHKMEFVQGFVDQVNRVGFAETRLDPNGISVERFMNILRHYGFEVQRNGLEVRAALRR